MTREERTKEIALIKDYARKESIPIMQDEGIEFLTSFIEKKGIKNIDFNCDLAQSFGIYKNSSEYGLLDYVSSVNIACGFHAGDPLAIKEALLAAKERNVVVGAHIGYDDIQGFGYRPVDMDEDELEALVMYQVGALMTFAKSFNMEICLNFLIP